MFSLASFQPAVVAVTVLLVAFTLGCAQPDRVRIGFVGDLMSDLGVGGRNGAQLAVETLNTEHRVRYELLVEDDRSDPNAARIAIASFASRGVAFVVGPMTSAMAVAAVPEANHLGIVLVSPTATTGELSAKDDFFFRTAADAPAGARQLVHFLHDHGARSIVVMMDSANGAYSLSFGRAAAMEFLKLGGRAAQEIFYRSGNTLEFADAMRQLGSGSADTVILVNSPSDAAIVTQHLRRVAPHVTIALSPWGSNVQFVQVGGRATESAIAAQAVDLESRLPRMRDFVTRYRTRFGTAPTTPAVQSYEAVMLGVDASSRRGARSLRTTLSVPGQWAGLDGTYSLDACGDAVRLLHLATVHDGRFQAIPQ